MKLGIPTRRIRQADDAHGGRRAGRLVGAASRRSLGVSRIGGALVAIPFLVYMMKSGMAYSFTTGDPLLFGIAPWLILLALDHGRLTHGRIASLCALSAGSRMPLLDQVLRLVSSCRAGTGHGGLFARQGHRLISPRLLVHLGVFAIVVGLSILSVTADQRNLRRRWVVDYRAGTGRTSASQFVVSMTAALGDVFLYVSPGVYRACGALGAPAWLFKLIVSIFAVASIGLVVLLIRRSSPAVATFCGAILVIPLAALGYLTLHDPVSYLQDATRYCYPFWMFLQTSRSSPSFSRARRRVHGSAGGCAPRFPYLAAGLVACLFCTGALLRRLGQTESPGIQDNRERDLLL